MSNLLWAWLPALLIVSIAFVIGARQMREYRGHIQQVTKINNEIVELNRRNHEVAHEQLKALNDIKSLLQDRNA
jgi:hypothetical protein